MDRLNPCIALVEDNPADAEMLKVALQEAGANVNIVILRTGAEALAYLLGNDDSKSPLCDLVILDLNLPKVSGFEVLEKIRGADSLKALPVVMMSGSKNREEIDRCYSLGANAYISKPTHLSEIYETAAKLMNFWFDCAQIPTRRSLRAWQPQ